MPDVTLKTATIAYHVFGPEDSAKPPVVFVHGALTDYRLWTKVAERLAESGYRAILPTLPLGSHTIPVGAAADQSPRGVALLVGDLITELGLDDVTLVGADTGGALCQILVDERPDLVGRLVLTNCDAFDQFPPFPFNVVFALLRTNAAVKSALIGMRSTLVRHSPVGFGLLARRPDPAMTQAWVQPARADARIRGDLTAFVRNVAGTDLTGVTTRMSAFTKPVAVVWGQRDRVFTPELGRRLAAQFPDATLIEVPEARTFVSLDEPAAVADAIVSLGAPAG